MLPLGDACWGILCPPVWHPWCPALPGPVVPVPGKPARAWCRISCCQSLASIVLMLGAQGSPRSSAGRSWVRHGCLTMGTEGAPTIPVGLGQAFQCQTLWELTPQLQRVYTPSPSASPAATDVQLPPNLPALSAAFSHFSEKCVMNNYFGIGLDAKISLEFNNKRDEHPKKCRLADPPPADSPGKNM